jgi:diguanylate cyclase
MRRTTTRTTAGARVSSVHRAVAIMPWAVLAVGFVADRVAASISAHASQTIVVSTLAVFFPSLLLRLALAVRLYPVRRKALALLLAAVVAWSLGSMSVTAATLEEQTHFPAPGEWLFLLSYIGMAGFLMLDVDRKQLRPSAGWLDIAVICGGTSCLASLLLVAPVRIASGQEGLPLLLAVVYPLADTMLALVVLGQALLRARTDSRQTVMFGAAFLLLAAADSSFALQVSAPTYDFGTLSNTLWGCSSRRPVGPSRRR